MSPAAHVPKAMKALFCINKVGVSRGAWPLQRAGESRAFCLPGESCVVTGTVAWPPLGSHLLTGPLEALEEPGDDNLT